MLYLLFNSTIPSIMLVTALSLDAFVASFCYGSSKIKIPFKSVVTISFICSATLAVTLYLGVAIKPYIPYAIITPICFLILFIIGIIKFFDGCIKTLINKHKLTYQQVSFKLHDLRFILQIYADSTQADIDHSKELSPKEAACLALALSFDGLAVGFGAGLSTINPLEVILFSIVFGIVAVLFGGYIGSKLSQKLDIDLSWVSGLLLIVLALLKW